MVENEKNKYHWTQLAECECLFPDLDVLNSNFTLLFDWSWFWNMSKQTKFPSLFAARRLMCLEKLSMVSKKTYTDKIWYNLFSTLSKLSQLIEWEDDAMERVLLSLMSSTRCVLLYVINLIVDSRPSSRAYKFVKQFEEALLLIIVVIRICV